MDNVQKHNTCINTNVFHLVCSLHSNVRVFESHRIVSIYSVNSFKMHYCPIPASSLYKKTLVMITVTLQENSHNSNNRHIG
jgi:hypothetical protein